MEISNFTQTIRNIIFQYEKSSSPASLSDNHLSAEIVKLIPEFFGLKVADHMSQLLAVGSLHQQRIDG